VDGGIVDGLFVQDWCCSIHCLTWCFVFLGCLRLAVLFGVHRWVGLYHLLYFVSLSKLLHLLDFCVLSSHTLVMSIRVTCRVLGRSNTDCHSCDLLRDLDLISRSKNHSDLRKRLHAKSLNNLNLLTWFEWLCPNPCEAWFGCPLQRDHRDKESVKGIDQ
jgi:hypothetical protein